MRIEFDTNNLSDIDRQVLAVLSGASAPLVAETVAWTEGPVTNTPVEDGPVKAEVGTPDAKPPAKRRGRPRKTAAAEPTPETAPAEGTELTEKLVVEEQDVLVVVDVLTEVDAKLDAAKKKEAEQKETPAEPTAPATAVPPAEPAPSLDIEFMKGMGNKFAGLVKAGKKDVAYSSLERRGMVRLSDAPSNDVLKEIDAEWGAL